ncbi:hypothetical protein [uncultured Sphingomonas sp.]|uniref:hypothetical protein n=1 Tax=uncultured Sphingomonas sp. TaxID=158754 RepID=UPI00261EB8A8|nr:hypothetical protein [uncultured Sphingomonas sp.]
MIHDLLHAGNHDRLTHVERKPDETLHDYLVRCQSELTDRVILLASVRDGYLATLGRERGRWRRSVAAIALAEAASSTMTCIVVELCGARSVVPAPVIAGVIGIAALAGGAIAFSIAPAAERLVQRIRFRRRQ